MSLKSWRDWFISVSTEEDEFSANELVRIESGTGHRDEVVKSETEPKCAKCKELMDYKDGMYIMLTSEWRVHIHCFSEVLTRHFENGEALDMTTGNIVKVEVDDS